MISAYQAASYIYGKYEKETNTVICEMKLHKLLYLSQRESLVMTQSPMFPESFEAWKYGPVMVSVREKYKNKDFISMQILELTPEIKEYFPIFDSVFKQYAASDAWTLSDLSHSQISWKNARKGFADDAPCNVVLQLDDIRQDAKNIAMRRFYVNEILPKIHENY